MEEFIIWTFIALCVGRVIGKILFYFHKKNRVWKIVNGKWELIKL